MEEPMTIQEKLEPLTRWTEADVQQWCRENPFVELGGTLVTDSCLVATAAKRLSGADEASVGGAGLVTLYEASGVYIGTYPISDAVNRTTQVFDCRVRDAIPCERGLSGLILPRLTVIEAAALMWPEVFADEAKRLVQSVDAKHEVEVAEQ